MIDSYQTEAGADDPAVGTARSFRRVLEAMSRPGKIIRYPEIIDSPPQLSPTLAGLLLTLTDTDTSIWLTAELRHVDSENWIRFHTGARLSSDPAGAAFAVGSATGLLAEATAFNFGTPEYPDRSTTMIVAVPGFVNGLPVILEGPGNPHPVKLRGESLDEGFWRLLQGNAQAFPLGLDCIFAAPKAIAAVPRSSTIVMAGNA
jgi:alpha-D-ribose 1-methylphosphonate 5-triphosphate synthase subunit PhnH